MIIVSQDKNKIINLDNVINIEYADYTNISRGHEIYCNGVVKNAIKLGVYKTKERAKEILQEIIKKYEHANHMKCSKSIIIQDMTERDFVYEMPEK